MMWTTRVIFALAGLAMLGWGALLGWEFISASTERAVQGIAWFVGGPLLHDGLVAPLVGLIGLAIVRWVPQPWRAPVAIGVVLSAILTLLAIPLLWRPFGVAVNPGLHDGNYVLGFAVSLAVVWLGAVAGGIVRVLRRSRTRAGEG